MKTSVRRIISIILALSMVAGNGAASFAEEEYCVVEAISGDEGEDPIANYDIDSEQAIVAGEDTVFIDADADNTFSDADNAFYDTDNTFYDAEESVEDLYGETYCDEEFVEEPEVLDDGLLFYETAEDEIEIESDDKEIAGDSEYGDVVATLQCGDNTSVTYYSDGTLVASGTGALGSPSFKYEDSKAFYNIAAPVKRVIVEEGITEIYSETLRAPYPTPVELQDSLEIIGDYSLLFANPLEIKWPKNLKVIGANSLGQIRGIGSIYLPDSLERIGNGSFFGVLCENEREAREGYPWTENYVVNLVIPEKVERIGYWWFDGVPVKNVIYKAPFNGGAFVDNCKIGYMSIKEWPDNYRMEDVFYTYHRFSGSDLGSMKEFMGLTCPEFDEALLTEWKGKQFYDNVIYTWENYPDLYVESMASGNNHISSRYISASNFFDISDYMTHVGYMHPLLPEENGGAEVQEITSAELEQTSYVYRNEPVTPSVEVFYNSEKLKEGEDYSLRYVNNASIGEAKVIVTGVGAYSGQIVLPFTIISGETGLILEDQKYYADDDCFTLIADFQAEGEMGLYDLKVSVSRNGINYYSKYFFEEYEVTPDPSADGLYHIKCPFDMLPLGTYDVKMSMWGEEREAKLHFLPAKPINPGTESGPHRELIVTWDKVGAFGDPQGYRIEYADNLEFKNSTILEVSTEEAREDTSSVFELVTGLVKIRDKKTNALSWKYISEKSMKRGAKLFVRFCGLVDDLEGKYSDILEVQIGNQILSEEFWGVKNSPNDLNEISHVNEAFLRKIFSQTMSRALFEAIMSSAKYQARKKGQEEPTEISFGGGICFGMVLSALAAYVDDFPSDFYGKTSLSEITGFPQARSCYSSEISPSAEEVIKLAHFLQYTDVHKEQFKEHFSRQDNSLAHLVDMIRACERGQGNPVLISIGEENEKEELFNLLDCDDVGHVVLGVCVLEDDEESTKIEICNPNEYGGLQKYPLKQYPNAEGLFILTLQKENGTYKGWRLGEGDDKYEGSLSELNIWNDDFLCGINCEVLFPYLEKACRGEVPFLEDQKKILLNHDHKYYNRSSEYSDIDREKIEKLSQAVLDAAKNGTIDIIPGSADTGASTTTNISAFFTDSNTISLPLSGEGADMTLASDTYYLKAVAGSAAETTLSLSDSEPGSITFYGEDTARHTALFYGRNTDNTQIEETTISLSTPAAVSGIVRESIDGNFYLKGIHAFEWIRCIGTPSDSDGSVQDNSPDVIKMQGLDESVYYCISEGKGELTVSEDADGDGEYEKIIHRQKRAELLQVPEDPADPSVASGYLTDTITWRVTKTGKLYLEGSGEIPDYWYMDSTISGGVYSRIDNKTRPWIDYDCKEVIVGKGITRIGKYAFAFMNIKRLIFSSCIQTIKPNVLKGTGLCLGETTVLDDSTILVEKGHSWDGGKVKLESTTKVSGYKEYTCTKCGDYKQVKIPKLTEQNEKIDLTNATVKGKTTNIYTGKPLTPPFIVIVNNVTLKAGTDYTYEFKNNVNAGEANVFITGKGKYTGVRIGRFQIQKATQPMTVQVKSPSVKARKVKKKKQTIAKSKSFTIKNAQGAVSFKKKSGSKNLSISSSGKITVKKGTKKGTYKIKVIVTAAGNANYNAGSKTVTVKVKVK